MKSVRRIAAALACALALAACGGPQTRANDVRLGIALEPPNLLNPGRVL